MSAWSVSAVLVANVLLRVVAHDRLWIGMVLNTFTPYVYLPAYAALGVAAWQRRRVLAGMSVAVVLAHLVWTFGPLTRAERPASSDDASAHAPPLRILTANVAYWNSKPEWIVAELLASDADVIAVQELSARWAKAFATDAFVRAYPHRVEEVRDEDGSAIYARVPLLEKDVLVTSVMPMARVTVNVDGAPVRIYSVHQPPPSRPALVERWSRGLDAVLDAARSETLPVVLAGDFNTTQHSAWYARFLEARYRGSHDACGRPLATTWPNGTRRFPPVRLDHVFLSPSLACARIAEGIGRGSDHRPVIVDIRRVGERG